MWTQKTSQSLCNHLPHAVQHISFTQMDQVVDCGLWNVGPLLFNATVKLLDIGTGACVVYADPELPNKLNGSHSQYNLLSSSMESLGSRGAPSSPYGSEQASSSAVPTPSPYSQPNSTFEGLSPAPAIPSNTDYPGPHAFHVSFQQSSTAKSATWTVREDDSAIVCSPAPTVSLSLRAVSVDVRLSSNCPTHERTCRIFSHVQMYTAQVLTRTGLSRSGESGASLTHAPRLVITFVHMRQNSAAGPSKQSKCSLLMFKWKALSAL
ncbi:hypothetical protein WMY93_026971 [Mugilogobius chulae]|uniref:Uncharacterized protein n=1 Tax=Mugilogobius chulae TaxID=88201 RepID=A0AAW0N1U2_9GOBI